MTIGAYILTAVSTFAGMDDGVGGADVPLIAFIYKGFDFPP